jgi:4-alpha-glucanotransferase
MNDETLKIIEQSSLSAHWKRIGIGHHHGIAIPLFSLYSKTNYGIGTFLDLIPLIDWCRSVNMDLIQLLPLNDTGLESSPYNASSSCALNPIYITLKELDYVDTNPALQSELNLLKRYSYLQRIAYESVYNQKMRFLRIYYSHVFKLFENSSEYHEFIEKHEWVKEYALFKVLKDQYNHKDWYEWHSENKNLSHKRVRHVFKNYKTQMDFYCFIQYLCFRQMRAVSLYARRKRVLLKGDIPILISPESLDVWLYREDFDTTLAAGAPPDMFSKEGQNWGFPIYNWKSIAQDNYRWWRRRLCIASEYYDIFRIDHIIGLYRIWAIEKGGCATKGSFIPKDRWQRIQQGERILNKLLNYTTMLPIGEDMGCDINDIRESMNTQAICGTRVIRWEKDEKTGAFFDLQQYNPLSLTSVSNHDSSTLAAWWQSEPSEAEKYCHFRSLRYSKEFSKKLNTQILVDSHSSSSLFHVNPLYEYLSLFETLRWARIEDERINVPGTVNLSNWCYRMRPSIEEIIEHKDLSQSIRDIRIASKK